MPLKCVKFSPATGAASVNQSRAACVPPDAVLAPPDVPPQPARHAALTNIASERIRIGRIVPLSSRQSAVGVPQPIPKLTARVANADCRLTAPIIDDRVNDQSGRVACCCRAADTDAV